MGNKVQKFGEQASPIQNTKKKTRTQPIKKITPEDIEKILKKRSIDYELSRRELEEIKAKDSEMNKYLNLKLKKKMKELNDKMENLNKLFDD